MAIITVNCGVIGATGSMNCGTNATKKPMDYGFNKVTTVLSRKAAPFDFPATSTKSAVALPADGIIRYPIQAR